MCGRWRLPAALQRTTVPVIRQRADMLGDGPGDLVNFQQITAQERPFGFYNLRAHYQKHDVPVRRGSVHGVPAMFLKSTRRLTRSFAREFVETGDIAQNG